MLCSIPSNSAFRSRSVMIPRSFTQPQPLSSAPRPNQAASDEVGDDDEDYDDMPPLVERFDADDDDDDDNDNSNTNSDNSGNSSGDNGTLATNEVVKRLNEENEAMKIKVKEMEEEFNKIKEDNARMKEDNVRISEELGAIKELLGGGNAIDKKTSSSSSSFTGASIKQHYK